MTTRIGWQTAGILAAVMLQAAQASAPGRILILTGRNNHDWKSVSAETRAALEESGRFAVATLEDPAGLTPERLGGVDAIVSIWNAFGAAGGPQADWPAAAKSALIDFVRGGKGHVVLHAGGSSFADWKEYQQLIGGASWKNGVTHHGAPHEFAVRIVAPDHPVTKGMAGFTTRDELWIETGLDRAVTVLAEGRAADGASWQPVAAVNPFGRGRNFILLLGHDAETLRNPGARTLLVRGTEWAATGAVTLPAGEPAPTAETVVPRVLEYAFGAGREPLRDLEALLAATKPEGREALADALSQALGRGGSPAARAALCAALGQVGSARHVPTLAAAALDPGLAPAAVGALERIGGDAARAALRGALDKADARTAPAIALAVGRAGDTAAVPVLIARAAGADAAVRAAAWTALGALATPEALAALMSARAKAAPEEREVLGQAICAAAARSPAGKAVPALDALAADANLSAGLRRAVWTLLFRTSEDAADRIRKALASDDDLARAAALRAVGQRNPRDFDAALAGALPALPPRPAAQALALLGRAGTDAARAAVRARLADTDDAVRIEAIRAAGLLDDAAAATALVARLEAADNDERRALAAALSRIGGAEVSRELLAKLDAPPAVARVAAEILAAREAPGRSVVPVLLKSVREGPPPAAQAAAKALGILGDAEAAGELLRLVAGGSDEQAKASLPALQQILRRPGADAAEAIRANLASAPPARRAGLLALLSADGKPATLALLLGQLKGDDLEARLAALRVLAQWKGREPLDALKEAAARANDEREKGLARRAVLQISGGTGGVNVALGATADSPDGLEKDGQAGGDAAGIDGNPKTYWDEVDRQPLYRYRVTLKTPAVIGALRITGWAHENYAPKDFEVLCDDKVVATVRDAAYEDNRATIALDPVKASVVELRITGSYGASPAIRELEILSESTRPEEGKP